MVWTLIIENLEYSPLAQPIQISLGQYIKISQRAQLEVAVFAG